MAFEELGPTFIKFGQILATREDMIPEEYAEEFKKLRDKVPPFDFSEVKNIFAEELNTSVEYSYKAFNPEPFAAASIAQLLF
ncbi:MAG: AarF/ABC1/UbiB kinase family protein [Candidatus Firestonebacteria bacterium]|nr:AarF/ABC1/UbiB kinase family protein [Candidatus Firestonebacteria bacterium]